MENLINDKQSESSSDWDFSKSRSKEEVFWFEKFTKIKQILITTAVVFLTLASITGAVLVLCYL